MVKFIPPISCPHCHKKTWKLITKARINFCPHCHLNLYPSKIINQDRKAKNPMNKKLALFFSFCVGSSVYMSYLFKENLHDNPLFEMFIPSILGLLVLIFSWNIIKEMINSFRSRESKYQLGVDTLEKITEDSCDYVQIVGSLNNHQCQKCQSFRLVDMYWFKRILVKNHEEIPVMAKLGDTERFVGCLHCKAQYKYSTEFFGETEKKFAIGLGVFLLMLLLAYVSNILAFIPEKRGLFWSCVMGLQVYSTLTHSKHKQLEDKYPLIMISGDQKD